jgi:hypothetical protein
MIKSHDFLHVVPGQMATRFDLGTHLFAPDTITAPRHTCTDPRKIRSVKTLESQLCYNARYAVDYKGRKVPERKADGRRWTLNLGACIECESPCEYGMERLRRLKIHELLELGCGADCLTCPEPCRVYKLAVGKIAAEEIQKAMKRKQAEAFARAALAQYLPEGAKHQDREQPPKGRAHRRSSQRAAGVERAEKKGERSEPRTSTARSASAGRSPQRAAGVEWAEKKEETP